MKRTSVNPWEWGLPLSLDQGELIEGVTTHLHCSGQVAVAPAPETEMGFTVLHPNEIRGQMEATLANVDAVLTAGGMDRSNILSIRFFTTDVDGFLENYDVYASWIAEAGTRPPQSLLGVSRLVLPDLVVEIEVVAGA
ncbi:MAG: RidA family protein [Gemmatimonadota bacterium]